MILAIFLATAVLHGPQQTGQGDLIGARDAVKQLTTEVPVSESAAKRRAFYDKVRSFPAASRTMTPREAAAKWLALIDEGAALPREEHRSMDSIDFAPEGSLTSVFGSLPRPESWPAIVEIVSKRPANRKNKAFLLLFARLMGDDRTILRLCKELSHPLPGEKKPNTGGYQADYGEIVAGVFQRRRDVSARLQHFEAGLGNPSTGRTEAMPDLAGLLGSAKAKPILLRIFEHARSSVEIQATATRNLAKQVVLANLDKIKRAPWELVDDAREGAFLDKMVAHYGMASLLSPAVRERGTTGTYLSVFLARGDVEHAAALLKKTKGEPDMESRYEGPRQGYGFEVSPHTVGHTFDSIVALQKRFPAVDLWDQYVTAAKASGKAGKAAKRISALVHDPKTSLKTKAQLFTYLIDLHSCLGDVPAVAQDYRDVEKLPHSRYNSDPFPSGMLPLALAVGDTRLIQEALAQKASPNNPDLDPRIDALIRTKRFQEAEEAEVKVLKQSHGPGIPIYGGEDGATVLCRIYYAAGRPKDVVTILQGFPFWSKDDLGEILNGNRYYGGPYGQNGAYLPLGFYAGWAFAKTGRKALAAQVLERLLWETDTYDEAFAVLNTIGGQESLGFYERLAKADPLNPRPLLWKADLLRRLRKLDAAEAAARGAIALDPADGAADSDHRFQAYAVLGAILKSKGNLNAARACSRKVEAGRLAAKAEVFADLGLMPQAIKTFGQSIEASPDDYVTEDRLAQCLDACGRADAAKAHHRRAVQLLPQCLGPGSDLYALLRPNMAGAQPFEADAVALSDLPGNTAGSAFVKGASEERIGKPREAVRDLKKAVKLAPRFRAALKELADLGAQGFLSQAATESLNLELIALSPGPSMPLVCDFNQFDDLRVAYNAVERALGRLFNQEGTPLFHLRKQTQTDMSPMPPDLYGSFGVSSSAASYLMAAQDISQLLMTGGGAPDLVR